MPDAHKNFAYSTVATAPSPATSGTSLVVATGDGAKFPAVPFNVTIWPAGAQPTTANAEIARCTARSTDTLTITRAQESSSARTVVVGDQIAATVTAKTLTDAELATADIWTAKGQLVVASAAAAAAALAVGADGKVLTADASQATGLGYSALPASGRHLPSGALATTFDRFGGAVGSITLTGGTLMLVMITLTAGEVISSITFRSGGTALATGTHQWFGLFDSSRAALKLTSDDTNTAWGSNTNKTLNLTAAYTVPTSGDYYLGCLVTATTVPSLFGLNALNSNLTGIAPVACGNTSDTGLTSPVGLPFTAGAITAAINAPYAWVS